MVRLTPWRNVRANTAVQAVWPGRQYAGWWSLDGHWFRLRDHRLSNTIKVAYEEIQRGWYTPPVEIRPGDVILDIGAHVGTTSLALEHRHPEATIFAYEPDPANYANLVHNLARNDSRVVPVHAGLWSEHTELIGRGNHRNTGGNVSRPGNGRGIRVQGFTLQQMLTAWDLSRVRVLKLDCEGAEFHLTSDDLRLVDSVLIEIHGDHGDANALLARLEAADVPYIAQIIHADGRHELRSKPAIKSQSLSRTIHWRPAASQRKAVAAHREVPA